MSPVALTYRTGESRSKLRTVIVVYARQSTVLLPTGRLSIIQAKLLHGTTCAHDWWAEILGTDPSSDDFAVPSSQVVQTREINIACRVTRHK